MNIIHRIKGVGCIALLATLLLACTENPNDWTPDSSFDRMFRPSGFVANNIDYDKATLLWKGVPSCKQYEVQLSETSDFSHVAFTQLVEGTSVNVERLTDATSYYARVRALAPDATKPHSTFSTCQFKSKGDQILAKTLDGDVWDNQIVVRWSATSRVPDASKLVVKDMASNTEVDYPIADFTANQQSIPQLVAARSYLVSMYTADGKLCGFKNYTTKAAIPTEGTQIIVDQSKTYQEALDELTAGNFVILINTEEEQLQTGEFMVPADCNVTVFGNPRQKRAKLKLKNYYFAPTGTSTSLRFHNVAIAANAVNELISKSADYTVQTIAFDDCLLSGFPRSLVRTQTADTKIENLVINNCIFYKMCDSSNDFITCASGGGSYTNVLITNSTFYDSVHRSFFRLQGSSFIAPASFVVKDCTFDSFLGQTTNNYLFDVGTTDLGVLNNVSFTNCIFGKTLNPKANGVRGKSGSYSLVHCFKTNDFVLGGFFLGGDIETYENSSNMLFSKSSSQTTVETINLTIKDQAFQARFSAGDPRWYPEQ